jgi:hypothetical protein
MKDGGCDTETLNEDSLVAHHKIALVFENMLKIFVGCYVVGPDKQIHELKTLKLFIDWRIWRQRRIHCESD